MAFTQRIMALRTAMEQKGCDMFLCSEPSNILYLTDFPRGLLMIPLEAEPTLLISPLELLAASEEAVGCRVEKVAMGETPLKKAVGWIGQLGARRIWYDTLEARGYLAFSSELSGIPLEQAAEQLWALRMVKDDEEIRRLREAARLAVYGMAAAEETIAPGVTEIQVAAEAEYAMRSKGSQGTSFETLVASGARSAMPHAAASDRVIGKGELIVVDLGATVRGYRSDLTRTFHTDPASELQLSIAEKVLEAQRAAKTLIKDGVGCAEVDAKSRVIIERAGYGEAFVHGLGHGVGLEVHEPPRLGPRSTETLKERNVVTVEPGIYLAAKGGFRNEDMVLVLKDGCEALTEEAHVPFP